MNSADEKRKPFLPRDYTFSSANDLVQDLGVEALKVDFYFAWKIADYFCRFEDYFREKASFYYSSAFLMIITAFFRIEKLFDVDFSILEFSFIGFLCCFLINYYFVRQIDIYPYIENEGHNTEAKVGGIAFFLSLVLVVYSLQTPAFHFAVLFFFTSFIFSFVLEKLTYKEHPHSWQVSSIAMIVVGIVIYANPFSVSDVKYRYENFWCGFIAAVASSFLLAYTGFVFKRLSQTNIFTINHIFSLTNLLFIPVFFPLEKVAPPSLKNWLVLCFFSFLFFFAALFFIRSNQIEKGSTVMIWVSSGLAFNLLFELLLEGGANLMHIIGGVLLFLGNTLLTHRTWERNRVYGIEGKDNFRNILKKNLRRPEEIEVVMKELTSISNDEDDGVEEGGSQGINSEKISSSDDSLDKENPESHTTEFQKKHKDALVENKCLTLPHKDKNKWPEAKDKLRRLSSPDTSPEEAVRLFLEIAHVRLRDHCYELINNDISLLKFIASLCLESEAKLGSREIPLSFQKANYEIKFSKLEVACLVALMFFNMIKENPKQSFPNPISFTIMLQHDLKEVIKCLFNYFRRVEESRAQFDDLFISFKRVSQDLSHLDLGGLRASIIIPEPRLLAVEEVKDSITIDFANKFIGGRALSGGNVQEETMFFVRPELYATMLLFEAMHESDAIVIIGADQYCSFNGYGPAFEFANNLDQRLDTDPQKRMKCVISAIDAIPFLGNNASSQFKKEYIDREVFKSVVGFLPFDAPGNIASLKGNDEDWFRDWPVSSGKWGCGASGGNIYLKYIIQTISASAAGRKLIFSCYKKDEALKTLLERFNKKLKGKSIGELYSEVVEKYKNQNYVWDSFPVLDRIFQGNASDDSDS